MLKQGCALTVPRRQLWVTLGQQSQERSLCATSGSGDHCGHDAARNSTACSRPIPGLHRASRAAGSSCPHWPRHSRGHVSMEIGGRPSRPAASGALRRPLWFPLLGSALSVPAGGRASGSSQELLPALRGPRFTVSSLSLHPAHITAFCLCEQSRREAPHSTPTWQPLWERLVG